ncbi:MAG: GNAT family N-acetyltransferase [Pseudorhodoplanes sp.]
MNPSEIPLWRAMLPSDLAAVVALSAQAHPNYPERREVLAEKLRLFPAGCFALAENSAIVGYCFSHPWTTGAPPSLDTFLRKLPPRADSYFIHDLTLDPSMRKRNLAAVLVPDLVRAAQHAKVTRMSLVAVSGSAPFWSRMGFVRTGDEATQGATRAKYGAEAVHMERLL